MATISNVETVSVSAAPTEASYWYKTAFIVEMTGAFIESTPNPLILSSVVPTLTTITLTFAEDIIASAYASTKTNWTVTGGNYNIVVLDVTVNTDNIVITTTPMVNGTNYTLNMPDIGIISASLGVAFAGPYAQPFVGTGVGPSILIIRVEDATTIDVVFDKPCNELDAKNENNYSIAPTLTVHNGIQKISQSIYRLTTDPQTVGVSYTVTASNIRDY